MAKKALGKGLGALIKRPTGTGPSAGRDGAGAESGREVIRLVARDRVVVSPLQPRKTFRDDQLEELVDSIRQHGVIQPLIVRGRGERLELIAGERRWRACEMAGIDEVPVIVRDASDRDVLEMALIENLQREDLNPVEEAEAYVRLSKEFDLTQEEIARRVGKNRATVANAMRLLDLEPEVRLLLAQGRLSTGHAKVLLGEKEPERQRLLAEQVVKKSLTVRQTEDLLSAARGTGKSKGAGRPGGARALAPDLAASIQEVTRRLEARLSTPVRVNHRPEGKGTIEIQYFNLDELDRILSLVGAGAEETY